MDFAEPAMPKELDMLDFRALPVSCRYLSSSGSHVGSELYDLDGR